MKVYTLKIYREAFIDIQVSLGDWRQMVEIPQVKDQLKSSDLDAPAEPQRTPKRIDL